MTRSWMYRFWRPDPASGRLVRTQRCWLDSRQCQSTESLPARGGMTAPSRGDSDPRWHRPVPPEGGPGPPAVLEPPAPREAPAPRAQPPPRGGHGPVRQPHAEGAGGPPLGPHPLPQGPDHRAGVRAAHDRRRPAAAPSCAGRPALPPSEMNRVFGTYTSPYGLEASEAILPARSTRARKQQRRERLIDSGCERSAGSMAGRGRGGAAAPSPPPALQLLVPPGADPQPDGGVQRAVRAGEAHPGGHAQHPRRGGDPRVLRDGLRPGRRRPPHHGAPPGTIPPLAPALPRVHRRPERPSGQR